MLARLLCRLELRFINHPGATAVRIFGGVLPSRYLELHRIEMGLEVAVLLSRSPEDARPSFTGGAFLVSEQRPGQQTQIEALTLKQGKV